MSEDLNNHVVMSDNSVLPQAEGEDGAAQVIRKRLAANTASGPTLMSASTVKLESKDIYCHDETTKLAALELREWEVLSAEQTKYEHQFMYPTREVNLAWPHEYHAMVTACLNGKIGEFDYMMLIDSGSELNIMTLQQAQDLALPIDDSGSSWTLKGISGHTMGLEGICWNVPVKIGGIEFAHNFFITCSDLGNKDMVLGQPWLFSHSTRINYIHDMGVTLQIWENGDRKG